MPDKLHTRVGRQPPPLYRDRSYADQVYDWNLTPGSVDTAAIAQHAVTNQLLAFAAQPYNTNLLITGTAYNAVSWDNGAAGQATLVWGDGTTILISVGSQTGLSDATTYWAYIDTIAAAPLTLTLTTNYQLAVTAGNVLLAIIAVGSSASGSKPTILPFTGRVPTISAVAIAANAITAGAIAADAIIAGKIAANAVIAGNIAVGAIVATEISATATITGATVQSASSGDRVILNSSGLQVIGSSQTFTFRNAVDGTIYGYARFLAGAPNVFDLAAINSCDFRLISDLSVIITGSTDITVTAIEDLTLSGNTVVISGATTILLSTTTAASNNISLESGDDLRLVAVDNVLLLPGATDQVIVDDGVALRLTDQRALRFSDADDSKFVAFRAAPTIVTDVTWLLPAADGSQRQVLRTDGSEILTFDWPHLPHCSVYRTGDGTIANSAATLLDWTENFDPDAMFSGAAPSKIIVPVAGKYQVTVSFQWAPDVDGERQIQLFVNGGNVAVTIGTSGSGTNYYTQTITKLLNLAASDYIEVKAYHSAGAALALQGGDDKTWFSVVRVGD